MLQKQQYKTALTEDETLALINKEITNACKRWKVNFRSLPAQVRVNIVPTIKTIVAKKLLTTYAITWDKTSDPVFFTSFVRPVPEGEPEPSISDSTPIAFTGEGIIVPEGSDTAKTTMTAEEIPIWFQETLHEYIDTASRFVIGSLKSRKY